MNEPRHHAALLLGLVLGAGSGTALADSGPTARAIASATTRAMGPPGRAPGSAEVAPPGRPLDLWTFELEDRADDQAPARDPKPAQAPIQADQAAPPSGHAGASQAAATAPAATLQTSRLAYRGLIHGDRERRGAVVRWGLGEQTQLTGFQVDPRDASAGDGNGYRLHGMLIEQDLALPLRADLQLTGGWLAGVAQPDDGAAAATRPVGSAWSLGGRAALLARRLHLSFEYAGSRLQPAGTAAEAAATATDPIGEAFAAGLELRSQRPGGTAWHLGTEYRWVGPHFASVANPALTGDRLRIRTVAGVQAEHWRLDLRLDRERDNLLHDPEAPTLLGDKTQIAATWKPPLSGIPSILGRPRIKLAADIERSRQLSASASEAPPAAHRQRKIRLESEFADTHWRWGITASNGIATDTAVDHGAVHTTRLRLYGSPAASAALPLKPALSWQRERDAAAGVLDRRWRAELRTLPIVLRDDLRANLDLGYMQQVRSDNQEPQDAVDLGGSLIWTLQRPTGRRGGLALAVSGSVRNGDSALIPGGTQDDYRLMLSLSTGNPLGGW